ncbi:MAG: antibiotic biosynthesis monooxygenase family protein [Acidimicrobiia bacterium]
MNEAQRTAPANPSRVTFEIVMLRIKPGVEISAFIAADHNMEVNFVSLQHGFISREVGLSKDGRDFFVIVRWATLEDAEAAAAAFFASPWGSERADPTDVVLFNHFVVGMAK